MFEISANDRIQLKDKKGAISALNGLGVTYSRLGEYEPAIKYYLKSLEFANELEEEKHIAALNNNNGIIYKNLNRCN